MKQKSKEREGKLVLQKGICLSWAQTSLQTLSQGKPSNLLCLIWPYSLTLPSVLSLLGLLPSALMTPLFPFLS